MHATKINELNFIELIKKKDEHALYYVIDKYGGLMQSVVRKYLHLMPDKCEECVNDVLLAVWEQINHYDPEKNEFQGWLASICKYKAIDFERRYYKQLTESPLSGTEPDSKGSHEEAVLAHEISEETESLLQNLSEEDRKLFWDCYVEGEPIQSVAHSHQMEVSAVYNHLSRGKKKLKHLREVYK